MDFNEFQVNEFLTLKLRKGRTYIYILDEEFSQCKYLLIELPRNQLEKYENIDSIDDASDFLDHSLEQSENKVKIPPRVEFWGHCSNLQAWAENDYDTRLLHSNLAFPLLKKLTDVGDPTAERVFKEEIARRIESGHDNVISYLISENYLSYFDESEFEAIIDVLEQRSLKRLFQDHSGNVKPTDLEFLSDVIKLNIRHSKSFQLEPIHSVSPSEKSTQISIEIKGGRIIRLNLINCNLRALPVSIKNLTALQELNLMWNQIAKLPEELGELTSLKKMVLSGNKLMSLHASIGNLKSLELLKMDHNRVEKLPSSMKNLTSLKTFNLWNNKLKEIPQDIGSLNKLRILGLSHNYIKILPEEISNLSNLETLDLSNNVLTRLPENIGNLNQLKVLWVNNNQLESLPRSLLSMENLKQLYLFVNPLNVETDLELQSLLDELTKKGVNIRIPRYMI